LTTPAAEPQRATARQHSTSFEVSFRGAIRDHGGIYPKLEAMRQMCQAFVDWKEPEEHGPMFQPCMKRFE